MAALAETDILSDSIFLAGLEVDFLRDPNMIWPLIDSAICGADWSPKASKFECSRFVLTRFASGRYEKDCKDSSAWFK